MLQNKLHCAITGKTAAEIINLRADSTKENAEREYDKFKDSEKNDAKKRF